MIFCKCGTAFVIHQQFREHMCEYKDYGEMKFRKEINI